MAQVRTQQGVLGLEVDDRLAGLGRQSALAAQVSQVLTALAEALGQRAAGRVFGRGTSTLVRWLSRGGERAECLHARHCHDLHLPHRQIDELRTQLSDQTHGVRLWLAV